MEQKQEKCGRCGSKHKGGGNLCGICADGKIVGLQTDLANAVKLLLKCNTLLKKHRDTYTDTLSDIKPFIKEYTK